MRLKDISVVIPVKNDFQNLKELLANLKENLFDDIHVVDSIHCENSLNLCKDNSATYVVFKWDGKYPKKRNWYLANSSLRRWVLFMDSDERLNVEFINELNSLDDSIYDGFSVYYNNSFLGKKLYYGDVMRKMPLIQKHIRFQRIDEDFITDFDMEVHEHPVIPKGKLGSMKTRIDHLERTSISQYLLKHNKYSTWEAHRLKLDSEISDSLRLRLKDRLIKTPYGGIIYFLYAYIIRRGFLDGIEGLKLALLKKQYFWWIYLKFKENE